MAPGDCRRTAAPAKTPPTRAMPDGVGELTQISSQKVQLPLAIQFMPLCGLGVEHGSSRAFTPGKPGRYSNFQFLFLVISPGTFRYTLGKNGSGVTIAVAMGGKAATRHGAGRLGLPGVAPPAIHVLPLRGGNGGFLPLAWPATGCCAALNAGYHWLRPVHDTAAEPLVCK